MEKEEEFEIKELVGFSAEGGVSFAGTHILVDMWGAKNLTDEKEIGEILKKSAINAKATILNSYMHRFEPHGVSGVVVLAESHISIHTWPEEEYCAIDIFMCGGHDPHLAIKVLQDYFIPKKIDIKSYKRGVKDGQ